MVRFRNIAIGLLIGSSLAACTAGQSDQSGKPAWVSNKSYYSENQPVVQRSSYVFDIATTGAGLPRTEAARLENWFDTLRLRFGDKVYLEAPYASPAVEADVRRIVGDYGLFLSEGTPVTTGTPNPGSARIVVRRSTASVPGCPNWRQAKNVGAIQSYESNVGCATNSNLAAMVADPEDLLHGREADPTADPTQGPKHPNSGQSNAPSTTGGAGFSGTSSN